MNIIKRDVIDEIIKYLYDKEIVVLHWARQVGKTSIMNYLGIMLRDEWVYDNNIIYIDLEDYVFVETFNKWASELYDYIKTTKSDFNKKIYVFLDEIQYLENPSSFLKYCVDHYGDKIKLIVSWSSSFAIKSKFKDSLVWRTVNFEIFWLSFWEYLVFKNEKIVLNGKFSEITNKKLISLYTDYVIWWQYPRIVLEKDIEKKEKYIKQIYSTYVKKDIVELANIKNINKFNNLVKILASQSGWLLNINEISKVLGIARQTIEDYLFILENTYIIKLIYPYYNNIRSELTKMPKIFFEDTWLLNLLQNRTIIQKIDWSLFETSIYSNLRKQFDVDTIKYWRTNIWQEIDFIIDWTKQILAYEAKLSCIRKSSSLNYFLWKYTNAIWKIVCLQNTKRDGKIYPWMT